jgi:hypothetical protein
VPSIVPKLLDVALDEWGFFGGGQINLNGTVVDGKKEYHDGAWQRVADYWRFIGGAYQNLTGKDRGYPWSAAFVSFCMHEAGASNRFPYSAGHARYLNKAIENAANGNSGPIVGRRLSEYPLKPGDLIGYWRGETKVTFDTARQIGWYESHSDIVVEVANGHAYSIGGNVSHSVTRRQVRLNGEGKLTDKSENWFVVVQNNM